MKDKKKTTNESVPSILIKGIRDRKGPSSVRKVPESKEKEPIIKLPNGSSEIGSPNTVGFKGANPIRSFSDYAHLQNILSSKSLSERASLLLEKLNIQLNEIDSENYAECSPNGKYSILSRQLDIYNMIWNEATLHIKEFSMDYAAIFAKLKSFYVLLFERFPQLMYSFQEEIKKLHAVIENKDQHIDAVLSELDLHEERNQASKEFFIGLQKEIQLERQSKDRYETEINSMGLEIDSLKSEITELRCQVTKLNEENNHLKLNAEKGALLNEENGVFKPECFDIGTNTPPLERSDDSNKQLLIRSRSSRTFSSVNSMVNIPILKQSSSDGENSSIRQRTFGFMIKTSIQAPDLLPDSNQGEYKKFFWVFPKICSIFLNGLSYEDSNNPFSSFDQVVHHFIMRHYQTSFLVSQIKSSLIQSAHILDNSDKAIHLFNMFIRNDYDFQEFRFFQTLLEFSVCYSSPDLSEIISTESLNPENTQLLFPIEKAQTIYKSLFPFWEICPEFNISHGKSIDFWMFLDICIKEFCKCREHLWSIVKNTLYLSDCSDLSRIPQKSFCIFLGLLLPEISSSQSKQHWKALLTRMTAMGKKSKDIIDFESLLSFVLSKDSFIYPIMKKNTVKNFAQLYFEWNASVLEIVSFLVGRIITSIPNYIRAIPESSDVLLEYHNNIFNSLLVSDISLASFHYRDLLHNIDGFITEEFGNMRISNATPPDEIRDLLLSFQKIEEVVGGL